MRFFIVGLHGGWRAWRLNLTNYMASQSTKKYSEKISDNDSDDALFASQTSQSSSSSHPPAPPPPPKKKKKKKKKKKT